MDKDTAKAINAVSNKINEVQKTLDNFISMLNKKTQSDVDYIAMVTDVDLNEDTDTDAMSAEE